MAAQKQTIGIITSCTEVIYTHTDMTEEEACVQHRTTVCLDFTYIYSYNGESFHIKITRPGRQDVTFTVSKC